MNTSRAVTPEGGSAVPLRVDCVADDSAGPPLTLYGTDIEGTELRVAVREPSITDPPLEAGAWYRFGGVVRSQSLGTQLAVPAGDGTVERIDTPERRTHPPLAELNAPWLAQLGAHDERITVTVQVRPTDETKRVRVKDPETFEIGAVCFAYCDQNRDTTVYHREEPDTRDEHLLLSHVVEDLSEAKGAVLVTRGGDHSPLELLYQRLQRASRGDVVTAGAERALTECFHATADSVAVRTGADTLVEAARQLDIEADPVLLSDYEIGIDPADWRQDWKIDNTSLSDVSDPQMTDRDYATLVERYLRVEREPVDSAALADCLKAYASADRSLLRELATHGAMDQAGCPRLSDRLLER